MGLKWLWFCLVTAAAFFVTYDCTKSLLGAGGLLAAPHMAPVTHMLAASLGEIVSLPVPHSHLDSQSPSPLPVHFSSHVYLYRPNSFSVFLFLEGQLLCALVALSSTRSFPFVCFPALQVPNECHQHAY